MLIRPGAPLTIVLIRNILFFLILSSLLASCYAYKAFPIESRHYTYTGERKKAFVVNPELKKEYHVLLHSGIYDIVNDSTGDSTVKIKLYPIEHFAGCGEPVILCLFTLGQCPVLLPDNYHFEYEEIAGVQVKDRDFDLLLATRYWFWDMFGVKKNFCRKAGRLLCYNYYAH